MVAACGSPIDLVTRATIQGPAITKSHTSHRRRFITLILFGTSPTLRSHNLIPFLTLHFPLILFIRLLIPTIPHLHFLVITPLVIRSVIARLRIINLPTSIPPSDPRFTGLTRRINSDDTSSSESISVALANQPLACLIRAAFGPSSNVGGGDVLECDGVDLGRRCEGEVAPGLPDDDWRGAREGAG